MGQSDAGLNYLEIITHGGRVCCRAPRTAVHANHETMFALPQPQVSNHLACLRWCGFVTTRREHRTIHYRLADERVAAVVELARALLHENAEHVAACRRVDGESS